MPKRLLILLPLFFLTGFLAFGQEGEKREKSATADTSYVIGKNRIVYKNRIYRQNAPYLTFGYGAGYGYESRMLEQNMTVAYHHFIRKVGLAIGYHSSSDTKIWWRSYQKLNDLFLGAGTRWEGQRYNFAVFAGPSLAYGSYIAWNPDREKDWAYYFITPGLVAEMQATWKLTYDIGIGLSAYASINKYYSAAGGQVHLYFSTAFVRNYD